MTDVLLESVGNLLARHGYQQPGATRILKGGNNRVLLLESNRYRLVAKSYFFSEHDVRDRLGTEFAFSQHLWSHGIRNIPEPLCCDTECRIGIYKAIPGRTLEPADVSMTRIQSMREFFLKINEFKDTAEHLKSASEACFSLSGHLDRVSIRIKQLTRIQHPLAERFAARVVSRWNELAGRLSSFASIDSELKSSERCLSPSDFGFHNALLVKDELYWLDFEYAGWDDPAKMVCDAVCQPALALPGRAWDEFLQMLEVHFSGRARQRAEILLPAYQLKWCCILLNEFRPEAQARRKFAGHPLSEQHLKAQLQKAESLISRIR